jgi:hypothetical protein
MIYVRFTAPSQQFTAEGLARRVVIRQDHTSLFAPNNHSQPVAQANQWDIFYIMGEYQRGFLVSPNPNLSKPQIFFVEHANVFEWNTYLSINFHSSPHESGRAPVYYYRSREAAARGQGQAVLREKPEHTAQFSEHISPQPVLREHEDSVYYVATLYDRVTSEGEYVFMGDYDMVYVKYTPEAHEFRRYVHRTELQAQTRALLSGRDDIEPGRQVTPNIVDEYSSAVSTLLGDWNDEIGLGIRNLQETFITSDDIPEGIGQNELDLSEVIRSESTSVLNENLEGLANEMISFRQNPGNWNNDGYAYIPAEWMD